MLIYHYDQFTRVLLGSSEADESPGDPGVFLIPAYATEIEPPETADGEFAVFDGTAWAVQAKPVPVNENINAAPDTLFGGPTIRESFGG